ncbi:type IV secretion system protein TrbL [Pseudomonas sp. BIGb0450]|uniref:P-type conjugative transfer protein TrbL n=1 Tax=unclassified Pseudomonas TaxID=196821 RepID=UPI00216A57B5|nr:MULTISPECIES: P-type conjugative transfer protein TrbL [unclassified Pseudomonas]MCS3416879.1 type IV secretion system protein TrbL [Pseudomonas sp. BIGb0558]MCS3436776.1 type IV secretion system protein TrbL [Pseudomonas sp. BIGb0450]
MDRRLLWFLAFIGIFIAGNALADTNLAQPDTSVDGLLDLILNQSGQWSQRLYGYAINLFWLLATIQLVWTFIPLVLKQADIGEIAGELVRFILVTGFFLALIKYAVEWATTIVDSFRDAGAAASGLERALQPGDVFAMAVEFSRAILASISFFSPGQALAISLAAFLVLICFAFIAAFMFVTLVESYVIINASVLFFGFGGSQWTREYAIAPIRFALAVGAKLFVLTLIIGLILQASREWSAAYQNNEASVITMAGLALICAYLTKTIPDLIGGMISGSSMGGGSAIGGMATAGAAGAAAAIATVATAGAAAPVAAGALSAASSGAGATAGSGLAGAINSSFANAASSAGGGASTSISGGASSGVGASTGGGATKGPIPAASKTGGSPSDATSSRPAAESGKFSQHAAKQSGKATQAAENKDPQQLAPKGEAVRTGDEISQAAGGTAKVLGVMASLAVPGMENAHASSLFPVANDSPVAQNNETETPPGPDGTESNVIRPASDTSTNHGRLASLNVAGTASNYDPLEK